MWNWTQLRQRALKQAFRGTASRILWGCVGGIGDGIIHM